MTEAEAVYSIREKLRQYSDDSDVDDREIIFELNNQRALYMRNQYNQKYRSVDPDVMQTVCMELEVADSSDCGCYDTGCYIVRTKKELPNPIELHSAPLIYRVAPIGKTTQPYNLVSHLRAINAGQSKFNKNVVYAFYYTDGKIYLKSRNPLHKLLKAISVTAVFENPQKLANFNTCTEDPVVCYDPLVDEYPIKAHALVYITEPVIKMLAFKLGVPEDKYNNADDDAAPAARENV